MSFFQYTYDDGCGVGATHLRIVSAGAKVIAARLPGYIEFFALSSSQNDHEHKNDSNVFVGPGSPPRPPPASSFSDIRHARQQRWGHVR